MAKPKYLNFVLNYICYFQNKIGNEKIATNYVLWQKKDQFFYSNTLLTPKFTLASCNLY